MGSLKTNFVYVVTGIWPQSKEIVPTRVFINEADAIMYCRITDNDGNYHKVELIK